MADVAKGYGVGDAVFVAYPFPSKLAFVPQARTIKDVRILDGTNEAIVTFTDGSQVLDGAVVTVFDTQAACATAIVNDVIVKIDATVNLDATLSLDSTVAQPALSLGRVDA